MGEKFYLIHEDVDKSENKLGRFVQSYSRSKTAALRAAKGLGPSGGLGYVQVVDEDYKVPITHLYEEVATDAEKKQDLALISRDNAIAKARAAGLTEDDIAALIFRE